MPGGQKKTKQNTSTIVTDSIKNFKMGHIKKKKNLKKKLASGPLSGVHTSFQDNVFG